MVEDHNRISETDILQSTKRILPKTRHPVLVRSLLMGWHTGLARSAPPMKLEIHATVTVRTQCPRAVPVDERTVGPAFEAVPALPLLAATQGRGTVDQGYVALRAAQGRRRCVGIHGDDDGSPRRRGCHRQLRFLPQSFRHVAATYFRSRVSSAAVVSQPVHRT